MQYKAAAFIDVDGTVSEDPSCWRAVHRHYGVSSEAGENYQRYLAHRDFPRWMREDIGLWIRRKHPQKLHISEIESFFSKPKLISGAEDLIRYLEREGYLAILITLGFSAATYPISDALKVPRKNVYANDFVLDRDRNLTGEGIARVYPHKKSDVARRICEEHELKLEKSLAITDTDWDSDLVESAGIGIAFNPKPDDPIRTAADHIVEERNLAGVIEYLESLK